MMLKVNDAEITSHEDGTIYITRGTTKVKILPAQRGGLVVLAESGTMEVLCDRVRPAVIVK